MVLSKLTVFLWVLLSAVTGFQLEDGDGRLCAFTSSLQGAEPALANELRGVVQENGTIRCSHGSRCYGLWERRADGEMHLLNQGCWPYVGNHQECRSDRCELLAASPAHMWKANYRFCCCARDLCNTNFTEAPPTPDTPPLRLMKTGGREDGHMGRQLTTEKTALVALVTVAIAAILIVGLFLGYSMMKRKHKHTLSALDVVESGNTESSMDLDHLKLLELIGRGRYGAVFRGSLNERRVAVKLFSSANRQNFANECSIYFLPLLRQHDNIARFLTADERTTSDGRPEFLILMEFYPHGCLSQYLSSHTVDWMTCCRMTHGVTRGLAFLHTELHRGEMYKPAVAHRDLTSRNVLVRADLSCVLADFGLSMRLTETRPCRNGDDDTMAISEVGTVRYMSPEVLGGALNLRDCEAALKQVDVYALGLLYWESFRRCSDLFPGEPVPEYQLAFQAELGNHPSFEEMQTLVVREKFRPRFPEAWKENSLAIRSLKETMEDCWDQDAEARLTAQCAEERLFDLALMTTQTAVHNQRNLSHGRWPPQASSASSFIEDFQVGVVRNLQGDAHPAATIRMGSSGADVAEKNRNHERQQSRLFSSNLPPPSTLCTISECQHTGGAVPGVPACLQLTEEDLEATKMEAAEVEKNLRENSHEDLMELSQKRFASESQSSAQLLLQDVFSGADSSISGADNASHPLPKQQNLPQRPTSLHLLSKTNHRQVQTGVAKMNTVAMVMAAEPHLVTTVTNNTNSRSGASSGKDVQSIMVVTSRYNAGVPTLVTNEAIGGGRSNPAGPREEEEEEEEEVQEEAKGEMMEGRDDGHFNLLNFSPDEHEPLLRREQPPAEDEAPPPLHHQNQVQSVLQGRGSNSNNNNNRLNRPPEGAVTGPQKLSELQQLGGPPTSRLPATAPGSGLDSGPVLGPGHQEDAEMTTRPNPTGHLVPECTGPDSGSCKVEVPDLQAPKAPTSSSEIITADTAMPIQTPTSGPDPEASDPEPPSSDPKPPTSDLEPPSSDPEPPAPNPEASNPEPQTSDPELQASDPEAAVPDDPASQPPSESGGGSGTSDLSYSEPLSPKVLQIREKPNKVRRPERPCSLDLSSSCTSSDFDPLSDAGSLSASGEKIKRRVKTPYTLKKWRPASWVVSTDGAPDPDFDFTSSSNRQTHVSSGLVRAGNIGFPKINQSKSSMAVFLVGGGATATTTSEPDGVTSF
ncbi:bone morphogenetic protein receptor type-2-like [Salarias fasciatus]|uniref:Serine/threonine-protein kinase receptor n=1 Tax=Salarias fasciatus TaxID=181472 RepID=A0A672I819_SALFA|nr:bone morphogenetic protein receptor type-2-like [Salarias fasciatus]XP_029967172.1 bone morphogenetic protein receptor type-2-like [Salarias fasciatus]